MNQQFQQAKQDFENKMLAMREKAQATFIAKYGEHTANFIGGIIDLSFRNGAVIAMLDGAPPLLRAAIIDLLSDLSAEISQSRGQAAGIADEHLVTYINEAMDASANMVEHMQTDAEAAMSRILTLH